MGLNSKCRIWLGIGYVVQHLEDSEEGDIDEIRELLKEENPDKEELK